MNPTATLIHGDCREELKKLPDQHFHCAITSPPYWGLRSYLPKEHPLKALEIGQEKTPQLYVKTMVDVFMELHRTLRDDGILWLNLGDCYSGSGKGGNPEGSPHIKQGINVGSMTVKGLKANSGKPKDLIGVPWRVAFALQEAGWYLRAHCPWIKRNGMPESTDDRPTTVVESIFMLTKSTDYYYDAEAIRKPYSASFAKDRRHDTGSNDRNEKNGYHDALAQNPKKLHRMFDKPQAAGSFRRSSDWFLDSWQGMVLNHEDAPLAFLVNTKGFKGAHFATFNPALVEPMVLSSASANGCCAKCGAQQVRIVERKAMIIKRSDRSPFATHSTRASGNMVAPAESTTLGWKPSCECHADVVPCRVIDPFAGSATVGEVCMAHRRDFTGIDLNLEYQPMQQQRTFREPELF